MDVKQPLALTPSAAAAFISISRSVLYEKMKAGDIPFIKIGATRLIKTADLEAFIDRHRITTEAEVA